MRKREQALTIPDSRRFIIIDVTDKGPHAFKLPRMKKAVELIKTVEAAELNINTEDITVIDFYEKMGEAAEKMCPIISACWHHTELELESTVGSDIAEELYDADYTEYEISEIFSTLYTAMIDSLAIHIEAAEETPDFLEQPGDSVK